MTCEIQIDRALFLADVLTTAAEGGIASWGHVVKYKSMVRHSAWKASFHVVDREENKNGVHEGLGYVDINIIDLGIRRIMMNEIDINRSIQSSIMVGYWQQDAGVIDAIGADAIVQAGLFGGLVYG